jgi:hypothetical protein
VIGEGFQIGELDSQLKAGNRKKTIESS